MADQASLNSTPNTQPAHSSIGIDTAGCAQTTARVCAQRKHLHLVEHLNKHHIGAPNLLDSLLSTHRQPRSSSSSWGHLHPTHNCQLSARNNMLLAAHKTCSSSCHPRPLQQTPSLHNRPLLAPRRPSSRSSTRATAAQLDGLAPLLLSSTLPVIKIGVVASMGAAAARHVSVACCAHCLCLACCLSVTVADK